MLFFISYSDNLLGFLDEFDKAHPKQDPVLPVCLTPPLPDPDLLKIEISDLDIKDELAAQEDTANQDVTPKIHQSCSIRDNYMLGASHRVQPKPQFSLIPQNTTAPSFSSHLRPPEGSSNKSTQGKNRIKKQIQKTRANNPFIPILPRGTEMVFATLPVTNSSPNLTTVTWEAAPETITLYPGGDAIQSCTSEPYICHHCKQSFENYESFHNHYDFNTNRCLQIPQSSSSSIYQITPSPRTDQVSFHNLGQNQPTHFPPEQIFESQVIFESRPSSNPLSTCNPTPCPNESLPDPDECPDINIDDLLGEIASEVDDLAKAHQESNPYLCLKCNQLFKNYFEFSNHNNFYHQC